MYSIQLMLLYNFSLAVLDTLMRKAQAPPEAEYVLVYQKCKYGINLIAKLGHHLSNPPANKLIEGFFHFLREFMKREKG